MSGTRLLVIGSRGFVGAHVARAAAPRFTVLSDAGIDITRRETIREAFAALAPDMVLLAAAISDIDRCQREPEQAEQVNVTGAGSVAEACRDTGARLIFTSTGAVFDGLRHGYVEDDPPTPVSVYGATKARAEALVAGLLPSAAIVRLSLVLGFGLNPGKNSLLDKLDASFRAGKPVAVPDTESRNPIDVYTLTEFVLEIAGRRDLAGLYHLGATESLSRYQLVAEIARRMAAPGHLVVRRDNPPPGRAPRGADQHLISDKIASRCGIAIPTLDQVFERCLRVPAQSHS